RNVDNVINLNNSVSNLKLECETWQRVKNNHDNYPLEPLPKINWTYSIIIFNFLQYFINIILILVRC
ncbi:MAG: hypothetical protein ACXWFZ_07655, partial [Nitrososphaeraceae archaeon]